MKNNIYDWVPTRGQELLLRSALSEPDEAVRFWAEWENTNDINNLDRGSSRLLPMVFQNLKRHISPRTEIYGKLKGTYRKSWYSNNMIRETAISLFSELKKNRIDPVLMKGIHLISVYYDDMACRPIGDADFLVSWKEAEKVGNLMMKMGWKMIGKHRYPVFSDNFMSLRRAIGFVNEGGYKCDLHWNMIGHRCYPGADNLFLKKVMEFEINGNMFRGLCTEDLLLHLIEHGAYGSLEPHIRWIPDVLMILKKEKNVDWDYFLDNTIQTNLEIPVKVMLEYLNRTFVDGILRYPIEKLVSYPISGRGKELHESMSSSRTLLGHQIKAFFRYYFHYQIFCTDYKMESPPKGVLGFINFLKFRWDIKSNIILPFVFMKKVSKKILGYFFRK